MAAILSMGDELKPCGLGDIETYDLAMTPGI